MSDQRSSNSVEMPTFRLEGRLTAPEIYVEGWTHFFIGYPVTKILFHSVVEPQSEGKKEVRKTQCTMVMPLGMAVQLAQTILAACKNNETVLAQAGEEAAKHLKDALTMIGNAQFPPGLIETGMHKPEKPKT